MVKTTLIARKETRCLHMGYSFRLAARVLLYSSSHRQDNTYHGLCYTSRGTLAGTINSSMAISTTHRERSYHGAISRSVMGWQWRWDGNDAVMAMTLIWQWRWDGNDAGMAMTLGWKYCAHVLSLLSYFVGNVVSPDVFFSFLTQWREHSFFNTEMFSILRFARYGKSQARPNGGGEGF